MIEIISLEGCPYSIMAQEQLEELKIPFKNISVSYDKKMNYDNHPIRTFPKISFNKTLIGGCDSLLELLNRIRTGIKDSSKSDSIMRETTQQLQIFNRKSTDKDAGEVLSYINQALIDNGIKM